MGNWHNVSKKEPCPICRKTDWCNLSDDGAVCICHRVESDRLAPSGSGWIHRLRDVEKKVKVRGEGEQWKVHFSQAARTPLLHSVLARLSTFALTANFFRGETPRDGVICGESSRIASRNAV